MQTCSKCGTISKDDTRVCGVCGGTLGNNLDQALQAKSKGRASIESHQGFLKWLERRPGFTGLVWGLLQAGSFWIPLIIITYLLPPELPMPYYVVVHYEILLVPIAIAFLFGYFLRDIGKSAKGFVICQQLVRGLTIIGIWLGSASIRSAFTSGVSSSVGEIVAEGLLLIIGVAILLFFFGFLACVLGSFTSGFVAKRRMG